MKKLLTNLPDGWSEKSLKNHTMFLRRGKSPVYAEKDEGLKVVNQDCIRWERVDLSKCKFHKLPATIDNDFFLKENDILINSTGTGTIGRVNRWRCNQGKFVADSHVTIVRVNSDEIYPAYATNVLSSELGQRYLESVCYTGSTNQIELSKRYLSKMLLPCPKISEQKAISRSIEILCDLIESAEKSTTALLKIKHSLIQTLFSGKRKPNGDARSIEELQITKYGYAPSNWKYCQIKDLVKEGFIDDIQDGNHGESHPVSSEFVEAGIPFVMASDIAAGYVDYKKCKKITKSRSEKLRIGFSLNGDVLLSHKASIGYTAIVENASPYVMLTPQVTYYRPNSSKLSAQYLKYFFQMYTFQKILEAYAKQSTRNYIGITNQKKLWIYLPESLAEQEELVRPILEVESLLSKKIKKIESLEKLQRSLMQNLLTGKVRLDIAKVNAILKEVS